MLKKVGIAVMALASLGAMLPISAAAAERGHEQARVIVQQRDEHSRTDFRRDVRSEVRFTPRVDERRVIVNRAPARFYTSVPCR
jgi:hypothetical protein